MRRAVPGSGLEGLRDKTTGSALRAGEGTDDQTVVGHTAMAKRGQALRKARAVKKPAKPTVDLKQENAALKHELARALERQASTEREALEQQTATAEVLQVINASPGNLAPVFTAMLEKATRLCDAGFGALWLYDGERFSVAATHALPAALAEFVCEPMPVAASASMADIVRGQSLVHVPDLAATELYHSGNHARRAYVDLGGARTLITPPR
jgi:hypothetical protein